MKRLILPFLAFFFLAAASCLLSGCGKLTPFLLNSSMDIHTDESGTRVITAVFDKDTLEDIFGNKNTSFQSFIAASCPDEMIWDYVETGSSYEMRFEIPFQSLEEYRLAVGTLSGLTDSVSVTRPQVGVKTGFTLSETSDTASLFNWMKTAMVSRSRMSAAKIDSLFTDGENILYYADRLYPQSGGGLYAYVENLLDAEFIDILTDISLDGSWKRTVLIRFPETMLDNAPNVKSYLTEMLPEGITEEWENGTSWVLHFPEGDRKQIGSLMNGVFQSQEERSLSEDVLARNSLTFVHNYKEPLNLAFFAPSAGETLVRYYINELPGAQVSVANSQGQTIDAISLNHDYAGYTCLFSEPVSSGTLEFTAVYPCQPLEIHADTEIISEQDIRRTITLLIGNELPEVHRNLMIDTMKRKAEGFGTVQEFHENGLYSIRYILSGNTAHVNAGFQSFFSGSASLEHTNGSGISFSKTLSGSVSDYLDFAGFLQNPEQTLITATLTLPGSETYPSGGHSISALFTSGVCRLSDAIRTGNPLRFWLIALCSLIGLLILWLLINGPLSPYLLPGSGKPGRVSRKSPSGKSSGRSAPGRQGQNRNVRGRRAGS